jgi:hypothetical protein
MADVDPNREAELAHELEELKVQVDTQVKALHTLRSQMAVLVLKLSAIRARGSGGSTSETLQKIATIEVKIAELWCVLDDTPISDRDVHHRIRNEIQTLVAREYMIKKGLGDPADKKS